MPMLFYFNFLGWSHGLMGAANDAGKGKCASHSPLAATTWLFPFALPQ